MKPAEAYAKAKLRTPDMRRFLDHYPFGLDEFQNQACEALTAGKSVLVAAPTGAGKTVVGEFAIHLALERGKKCFYTTPIKALSNQKYTELTERYGADKVGILTGDNSINGEAPIVVMTTEVLRNMLYAESSTLHDLSFVVMDEVHYLADRFRGAVWEEVIIHLPERISLVALSATVSNAEEFGAWLETVRGDTAIVVEEHRPVPLYQHVMAGQQLHDLFVDDSHSMVNPDLVRMVHKRSHPRRRDPLTPWRTDVVERLEREKLLPAIYFLFSRAGCDDAVEQCMAANLRLTDADERRHIRHVVQRATLGIPDSDLAALEFDAWQEALERGVAAHHAGMLPVFKEVVEHLFQSGFIKIVFATETLALGINMPAKSVVLEKLVKWNGESHVELTPGEFTQLTGRAGRRGIDIEGHAIILWHAGIDPRAVAGLASTRTYPLRSSFQPSYNMAVNLVSRLGWATTREVLESSFAQFQADRSVVGMTRSLKKHEEALRGYEEAQACHLGDFAEYAALRNDINRREKAGSQQRSRHHREVIANSLAKLRVGDIFWLPSRRSPGFVVLLDHGGSNHRPLVLNSDKQVRRIVLDHVQEPLTAVGHLRISKNFHSRNAQARRELAARLLDVTESLPPEKIRSSHESPVDDELQELRRSMRQHPCHGCDDREVHARWSERIHRAHRESTDLRQRIASRTRSIARRFDAICEVLAERGYLTSPGPDAQVTPKGEQLRWLFSEADLIASECINNGTWDGLNPQELSAVLSTLVFESRFTDDGVTYRLPKGVVEETVQVMYSQWDDIHECEKKHGLNLTRELDPGFVWAAYRWAGGATLQRVLDRGDLTAGDFVRWIRQLIDLLAQIEVAAPGPLGDTAHQAIKDLRRGVIRSLESFD
jgi:ATP-dependent RNA helicase HelY